MTAPLVVFGEDWGGHPSSTQHLVRCLARERAVLWIDSIGLRRPRLDARDLGRAAGKVVRAVKGVARRPGLGTGWLRGDLPFRVLAPVVLPLPGHPLARWLNRQILRTTLRRATADLSLERPILWLSLPTAVDAIGAVGERAVVYYCGDDFGALEGVDHGPVGRLEAELAVRADLIIVANPVVAAKFPSCKTRLIPHGVDGARFAAPAPRPKDLPTDRPVAGFFGSVSGWIDTELLAYAARALPHWCLVLVGPVRVDLAELRSLQNVVVAGPRRHEELPGYAQHWTVSLVPFRDTAQIRSSSPLKLREYLASGTPIAATPFPALRGYEDLVEIGREPADFVAAILRAAEEGRRRAPERQARVAGETWEVRARQAAELLDGL